MNMHNEMFSCILESAAGLSGYVSFCHTKTCLVNTEAMEDLNGAGGQIGN